MEFRVLIQQAFALDRGVNLRGRDARVPEHFLDGAQVRAAGQQVRGK